MELEMDYHEKIHLLIPRPKDQAYLPIEMIGSEYWTSESVAYDIARVMEAKAGTYLDEDGEDWFMIGYEGSPGEISVLNSLGAWVLDAWKDVPPYLALTFDELLDVLQQMHDFLKTVGR